MPVLLAPACRGSKVRLQPRSWQQQPSAALQGAGHACRRPSAPAALPWAGLAAAAAVLLAAPEAGATDAVAVFQRSCAGCHAGGGNVIRRDATLQLPDLQKYGLDSPEALFTVIYSGKGSMPGFGEECAPRGSCTFGPRLADDDIRELAAFVLDQAQQGWADK